MARKGTVSISFVVEEGKDGLKKLTLDAAGLRKVMAENVKVTERLGKGIYRVAATSTIIRATSDAVGQLTSALNDLTGESLDFGEAVEDATKEDN